MSLDKNGFPIIILPFMQKTDLHQYLRNYKDLLPQKKLFEFAQQIAEGINKISSSLELISEAHD